MQPSQPTEQFTGHGAARRAAGMNAKPVCPQTNTTWRFGRRSAKCRLPRTFREPGSSLPLNSISLIHSTISPFQNPLYTPYCLRTHNRYGLGHYRPRSFDRHAFLPYLIPVLRVQYIDLVFCPVIQSLWKKLRVADLSVDLKRLFGH